MIIFSFAHDLHHFLVLLWRKWFSEDGFKSSEMR
jgi:hypothetical protein